MEPVDLDRYVLMKDLGFPQGDKNDPRFPYVGDLLIPRLEDLVDIPWCEQHQRIFDGSWCVYTNFQVPDKGFIKARGESLREALENLFIDVMTNHKDYAVGGK